MKAKLIEYLIGEGGPLRVRALLAFMVVGTTCLLYVMGMKVDDELKKGAAAVVGFYFLTRSMGK